MNNNLEELTGFLYEEALNGNVNNVMEYIDKNVMCIGMLNTRFIAEYDDVEKFLMTADIKCINIFEKNFYSVYQNDDIGIVLGICTGIAKPGNNVLNGIWLSLLWRRMEACWKINYIHLTVCLMDNANNRLIAQTTKMFSSNQAGLANSYIQMNSKLIVGDYKNNTHFIIYRDIIYIEANNTKTCIHTKEEIIEYHITMLELEKKLPNLFFRIHRSYIINVIYVTEIRRYEIELCSKIKIAIPEKKYKKIKEAITDKINKLYR